MNKKIYIIGTIVVVIGIIVMFATNSKPTTFDESQTLATTTANTSVASTTASSTTKVIMYTMSEISTHKDATSCWTTIDGKVYDLTKAIDIHPGGREKILSICGKDGSAVFGTQHGGQEKPTELLATLVIGELAR